MKVIEVEVRVGLTKNEGNYESSRLDYSMRTVLTEGEAADAAIDTIRDHLQEKINRDSTEEKD